MGVLDPWINDGRRPTERMPEVREKYPNRPANPNLFRNVINALNWFKCDKNFKLNAGGLLLHIPHSILTNKFIKLLTSKDSTRFVANRVIKNDVGATSLTHNVVKVMGYNKGSGDKESCTTVSSDSHRERDYNLHNYFSTVLTLGCNEQGKKTNTSMHMCMPVVARMTYYNNDTGNIKTIRDGMLCNNYTAVESFVEMHCTSILDRQIGKVNSIVHAPYLETTRHLMTLDIPSDQGGTNGETLNSNFRVALKTVYSTDIVNLRKYNTIMSTDVDNYKYHKPYDESKLYPYRFWTGHPNFEEYNGEEPDGDLYGIHYLPKSKGSSEGEIRIFKFNYPKVGDKDIDIEGTTVPPILNVKLVKKYKISEDSEVTMTLDYNNFVANCVGGNLFFDSKYYGEGNTESIEENKGFSFIGRYSRILNYMSTPYLATHSRIDDNKKFHLSRWEPVPFDSSGMCIIRSKDDNYIYPNIISQWYKKDDVMAKMATNFRYETVLLRYMVAEPLYHETILYTPILNFGSFDFDYNDGQKVHNNKTTDVYTRYMARINMAIKNVSSFLVNNNLLSKLLCYLDVTRWEESYGSGSDTWKNKMKMYINEKVPVDEYSLSMPGYVYAGSFFQGTLSYYALRGPVSLKTYIPYFEFSSDSRIVIKPNPTQNNEDVKLKIKANKLKTITHDEVELWHTVDISDEDRKSGLPSVHYFSILAGMSDHGFGSESDEDTLNPTIQKSYLKSLRQLALICAKNVNIMLENAYEIEGIALYGSYFEEDPTNKKLYTKMAYSKIKSGGNSNNDHIFDTVGAYDLWDRVMSALERDLFALRDACMMYSIIRGKTLYQMILPNDKHKVFKQGTSLAEMLDYCYSLFLYTYFNYTPFIRDNETDSYTGFIGYTLKDLDTNGTGIKTYNIKDPMTSDDELSLDGYVTGADKTVSYAYRGDFVPDSNIGYTDYKNYMQDPTNYQLLFLDERVSLEKLNKFMKNKPINTNNWSGMMGIRRGSDICKASFDYLKKVKADDSHTKGIMVPNLGGETDHIRYFLRRSNAYKQAILDEPRTIVDIADKGSDFKVRYGSHKQAFSNVKVEISNNPDDDGKRVRPKNTKLYKTDLPNMFPNDWSKATQLWSDIYNKMKIPKNNLDINDDDINKIYQNTVDLISDISTDFVGGFIGSDIPMTRDIHLVSGLATPTNGQIDDINLNDNKIAADIYDFRYYDDNGNFYSGSDSNMENSSKLDKLMGDFMTYFDHNDDIDDHDKFYWDSPYRMSGFAFYIIYQLLHGMYGIEEDIDFLNSTTRNKFCSETNTSDTDTRHLLANYVEKLGQANIFSLWNKLKDYIGRYFKRYDNIRFPAGNYDDIRPDYSLLTPSYIDMWCLHDLPIRGMFFVGYTLSTVCSLLELMLLCIRRFVNIVKAKGKNVYGTAHDSNSNEIERIVHLWGFYPFTTEGKFVNNVDNIINKMRLPDNDKQQATETIYRMLGIKKDRERNTEELPIIQTPFYPKIPENGVSLRVPDLDYLKYYNIHPIFNMEYSPFYDCSLNVNVNPPSQSIKPFVFPMDIDITVEVHSEGFDGAKHLNTLLNNFKDTNSIDYMNHSTESINTVLRDKIYAKDAEYLAIKTFSFDTDYTVKETFGVEWDSDINKVYNWKLYTSDFLPVVSYNIINNKPPERTKLTDPPTVWYKLERPDRPIPVTPVKPITPDLSFDFDMEFIEPLGIYHTDRWVYVSDYYYTYEKSSKGKSGIDTLGKMRFSDLRTNPEEIKKFETGKGYHKQRQLVVSSIHFSLGVSLANSLLDIIVLNTPYDSDEHRITDDIYKKYNNLEFSLVSAGYADSVGYIGFNYKCKGGKKDDEGYCKSYLTLYNLPLYKTEGKRRQKILKYIGASDFYPKMSEQIASKGRNRVYAVHNRMLSITRGQHLRNVLLHNDIETYKGWDDNDNLTFGDPSHRRYEVQYVLGYTIHTHTMFTSSYNKEYNHIIIGNISPFKCGWISFMFGYEDKYIGYDWLMIAKSGISYNLSLASSNTKNNLMNHLNKYLENRLKLLIPADKDMDEEEDSSIFEDICKGKKINKSGVIPYTCKITDIKCPSTVSTSNTFKFKIMKKVNTSRNVVEENFPIFDGCRYFILCKRTKGTPDKKYFMIDFEYTFNNSNQEFIFKYNVYDVIKESGFVDISNSEFIKDFDDIKTETITTSSYITKRGKSLQVKLNVSDKVIGCGDAFPKTWKNVSHMDNIERYYKVSETAQKVYSNKFAESSSDIGLDSFKKDNSTKNRRSAIYTFIKHKYTNETIDKLHLASRKGCYLNNYVIKYNRDKIISTDNNDKSWCNQERSINTERDRNKAQGNKYTKDNRNVFGSWISNSLDLSSLRGYYSWNEYVQSDLGESEADDYRDIYKQAYSDTQSNKDILRTHSETDTFINNRG